MSAAARTSDSRGPYDVAIVGAGIVGIATARRLAFHEGLRVVVLEANAEIGASPASGGNSGIMHCGFDAPVGSLESRLMRRGAEHWARLTRSIGADWRAFKLPERRCGALLVAWSDEEAIALPSIIAKARANGCGPDNVSDVLPPRQVASLEPGLAPTHGGVLVREEYAVDSAVVLIYLAAQAEEAGATFKRGFRVASAVREGAVWRLAAGDASCGEVRARAVVNCAGLHGDTVDKVGLGKSSFSIRPRKGQFVVAAPASVESAPPAPITRIILPVPTERTKGVLIAPTVSGLYLIGPTAEDQDDRVDAASTSDGRASLIAAAEKVAPGITDATRGATILGAYAGLRPATEHRRYVIEPHHDECWVTVGGIRSTGFTASMGIAEHVAVLVRACLAPAAAASPPSSSGVCSDGAVVWSLGGAPESAHTAADLGTAAPPPPSRAATIGRAPEPPLFKASDVDNSEPGFIRFRLRHRDGRGNASGAWRSFRLNHPLSLMGRLQQRRHDGARGKGVSRL